MLLSHLWRRSLATLAAAALLIAPAWASHPLGINQGQPDQASGFFIDGAKVKKPWLDAKSKPLTGDFLTANGGVAGKTLDPVSTYVGLRYTPAGVVEPHDFITRNVKQFYFPSGDAVTGVMTFFPKEDGTITINMSDHASTQVQLWPRSLGPVDLHVVPTVWRKRWDAGEVISPDLLARSAGFSSLRFMDSAKINGNLTTRRPLPTDDTQFNGMAVEYMVAIANALGEDMILPIGAHWDDATIADAITVANKQLDPRLKINVEWANEVWNGQFEASTFALAQGNLKWTGTPAIPAVAASAGVKAKAAISAKADPNAQRKFYGFQAGRIANIIKTVVFHDGKPSSADLLASRVKVSLAWKRTSPDAVPYIVEGYESVGAPIELINDVSFGIYPTITNDDRPNWIAWSKINDIDSGVGLLKAYVDRAIPIFAQYMTAAKAIGPWVKLNIYETSIDQLVMHPPFIQDKTILPTTVAYSIAVTHSPGAVANFARMHDAFIAAGGTTAHYFDLINVDSEYGIFGIHTSAQDTVGSPVRPELDKRNAQGWAEMGQRGYFGPER